jgi:tRNA pseudouridine55 synthase
MQVAVLAPDGLRRARLGQPLSPADFTQPPRTAGPTAWLDAGGALVGIGEARDGALRVLRNLAT